MDWFTADDPQERAGRCLHTYALADQHYRIVSADRREMEKALLVDKGDHQADLVDVACQHHCGSPAWINHCRDTAVTVRLYAGSEVLYRAAPHRSHRSLVPAGAGGLGQLP